MKDTTQLATATQLAMNVVRHGGSLNTRWAHQRGEVLAIDDTGQAAAVIATFPTELKALLWATQVQHSNAPARYAAAMPSLVLAFAADLFRTKVAKR